MCVCVCAGEVYRGHSGRGGCLFIPPISTLSVHVPRASEQSVAHEAKPGSSYQKHPQYSSRRFNA